MLYNQEKHLIDLIKRVKVAQYRASYYQRLLGYLLRQLWLYKEDVIEGLEQSIKEEIKRVLEKETLGLMNFNQDLREPN